MSERPSTTHSTEDLPPLELAEKGRRGSEVISLDRRLFMKFTAFGRCLDPHSAIDALEEAGVTGALYLDANDPQGIGVIATAEDPDYFVTTLRTLFNHRPFADFTHKAEFDMLGRTYSIGYEPDLEDTLFTKPQAKILSPAHRWAVWYPLQRAKRFETLAPDHQRRIFAEHASLGKRYGAGGHAADVRLACHGLDRNDNEFVIGLIGKDLHPLSHVVQSMRKTRQTAEFIQQMGPFFVGHAVARTPG